MPWVEGISVDKLMCWDLNAPPRHQICLNPQYALGGDPT